MTLPNPKSLSYSRYKKYRECPKKYKYLYVDKLPSLEEDRPLNRFLGCIWAELMECFYLQNVLQKAAELSSGGFPARAKKYVDDWLKTEGKRLFSKVSKDLKIVWDDTEKLKQHWQELADTFPLFLSTLRVEKLFGKVMVPERKYAYVNKGGTYMNGRADLFLEKEIVTAVEVAEGEPEIEPTVSRLTYIIDGKAGKDKKLNGSFLDPDQLRFYVHLHEVETGERINYAGFLQFRYGCVRWVDISDKEMLGFLSRLKSTLDGIREGKFTATPSNSACKFCDHKSICAEYAEMQRDSSSSRTDKLLEDDMSSSSLVDNFGADLIVI